MQSADPNDFGSGATSNAVTLGADVALGAGFGVAVSATQGRTGDSGNGRRNLSIADGGIGTSAYEIAFSKAHVVDGTDRLRFSLSQPMHVDFGRLNFSSVQVVDRQTGELGVVTQSFAIPGPARQLVGELLYARPLGRIGQVSLFGRAQLRGGAVPQGTASMMGGSRLSINF